MRLRQAPTYIGIEARWTGMSPIPCTTSSPLLVSRPQDKSPASFHPKIGGAHHHSLHLRHSIDEARAQNRQCDRVEIARCRPDPRLDQEIGMLIRPNDAFGRNDES